MASYTKQMIDLAKTWLAVNPDPASPFLAFPRIVTNAGLADGRNGPTIQTTERYLRDHPEARSDPALMAMLDELRSKVGEYADGSAELRKMEDDIEHALNKLPTVKHNKVKTDVPHNAYLARWCLAWARQGYNTIELSPDFAAAMLLTDPRELDIAGVQMPFRGILFLIPDGFAKGREGLHYTKVHITETSSEQVNELATAHTISDALSALSQEERQAVLSRAKGGLDKVGPDAQVNVLIQRAKYSRLTDQPDRPARSNMIRIHATDGVHALETTIDRDGLTWDAFEQITSDVDFTADVEAMRAVRQIVFGALAYATAIPTATTPVPNENTRAPRKASEPTAKRWEIGRTIRIDHNLVRSVRGGSREVLYRLKHRHIVRGHYKNQVHGSQRSLRKTIWVQPFWRGPEDGAALVHTYKLDTEPGPSE